MANEIVIVVKARNEASGVFQGIEKEAEVSGDKAGKTITDKIVEKIKVVKDDPTLREAGGPIGDTIGRTISEHVTDRLKVTIKETVERDVNGRLRDSRGRFVGAGNQTVHEKVKVDVDVDEQTFGARLHKFFERFSPKLKMDVDKQSFLSRLKGLLTGAGSQVGDSIRTGFTSVFSGDILSTIIKTALVGVVGGGLFSLIGPALGSAFALAFGGGAIAAGVISALKDPGIQSAIGGLKKDLSDAFSGFGTYFKGPVFSFFEQLPSVIKPLQPMVATIAADLAPVAQKLGQGVIGFLQNVLPSIGRMIDKSGPVLEVLADKLPGLGDALARLFDHISSGAPEAANFFKGLLDGVILLIKFIGKLVQISYNMYAVGRQIFGAFVSFAVWAATHVLDAFIGAFGWIPGIRKKLDAAKEKMRDFAKDVNRELNDIPDSKTFTLIIRTVGSGVASALGNLDRILGVRAAGGITGSANGATPAGLTWVGEHGPELLAAPAGSRVYSSPDSMRMAGRGGGGGGPIIVPLVLDGHTLATVLIDPQRRIVRQQFGGSVQAAYGIGA